MTGRHRATGARHDRAARPVETSDFVAFMLRCWAAWGDRVGQDPAALTHLDDLIRALADHTNRGIFLANKGQDHYSQRDIAAILGLTRQAIAHRIKLGELAHAAHIERRGGGAMVRMADIRARRAELLEAAGLDDRTGSERERSARRLRAAGQ